MTSDSYRYRLLDPLRGLAIISVMLLHFCERGIESSDNIIHARLWTVVQHGYLGVQMFFVISGFCISAALYGSMNKKFPLRHFLHRRLRRIFPPYWASLTLVVILGFLTILILDTPIQTVFPLTTGDWICNILLIQGPMHATDANLVYWSLSIELQFYLVMAVALLWSRYTEVWLVIFSSLSFSIQIYSNSSSLPIWGTIFAHWSEFLCGIAGYYWITGNGKSRLLPWLLVGFVFGEILIHSSELNILLLQGDDTAKPSKAIKLCFCLCCLSLMLACQSIDAAVCRTKFASLLQFFGLISYSLYLTHVPVGTRLFNFTDRVIGLDGLKWTIPALAAIFLSTAFAMVFYRWCERPWISAPAS